MRKQHVKLKAKYIDMMCAIAAIVAGVLGVIVLKDATVLVVALLFAPVLFFKKHIYYFFGIVRIYFHLPSSIF